MTNRMNLGRMRAVLLPSLLALTPTVAMAQAQSSQTPTTAAPATSQAAPPAGTMGQRMMMDDGAMKPGMGMDKMKPGMGKMDCMGKPCGSPQGAAGKMGGMPQSQSMGGPDAAVPPAASAAQPPTKDHM